MGVSGIVGGGDTTVPQRDISSMRCRISLITCLIIVHIIDSFFLGFHDIVDRDEKKEQKKRKRKREKECKEEKAYEKGKELERKKELKREKELKRKKELKREKELKRVILAIRQRFA